ncbi:TetR/AcrR family transcriptional regulator [Antrihabitans sp. YC3-6]|uniref:TetR/AcrR family transcriptional regulator n=1 Tax=Antrihabitans stalagmiti TaxID=2799499 RepID=A0A934NPX7_9NOCA|nr:TetR/AcrR family transcriptional regulator [Antrihabitans stalagmiti]MBJ8339127.1 TetR/AcrR family transcriptional regulator [Antrihabitans stalagmiti]
MLQRAFIHAVERVDDNDQTRTRLLDAAYEQFCRMGIQRSSMEDVARGAKLSRITVYRRFATKDALVEQVILREFRRYFEQFLVDIAEAPTAADRVVLGFVSSLRAIRGNALIGGLLTAEPNLLAGSMIGDDGRMLAAVRQFVAGQLSTEQAAGNVSEDLDTSLVAEMMVRVSASFLAIPCHIVDLDDDDQLASIAWQFLVPMLDPPDAARRPATPYRPPVPR